MATTPEAWSRRWAVRPVLVALVVLACLAPFLTRAFNLDEPLFLLVARHLGSHPLDFFGFSANWYGTAMPMSAITKNPPLASYYLALAVSLSGWGEAALHAAFLPVAVAAAVGTCFLARELGADALTAGLATVLTPAFLVSGSTVMCDTLMLAFWVWAVFCWVRGLRAASWAWLLAAGLLAAACALTKYFGMALLPLFAAHALAVRRDLGRNLPALLPPLAILLAYQGLTHHLYGEGLLLSAGSYALNARDAGPGLFGNSLRGLAFAGGALASGLFLAPLLWSWRQLLAGLAAALLATVAALQLPGLGPPDPARGGGAALLFALQLGLLLAGGAQILLLAAAGAWRRREPEDILLLLWVVGTFGFATYLNWVINVRSILPMAPAAGILLARRLADRRTDAWAGATWMPLLAFVPALALGVAVTWADARLADTTRTAAGAILRTWRDGRRTVWFQGHWGFQLYMELGGGRPLDYRGPNPRPGDLVVVPSHNTNTFRINLEAVRDAGRLVMAPGPGLATMSRSLGAGFHSSQLGALPFAFGRPDPEIYSLFQVVRATGPGAFSVPPGS